MLLFQQLKNTAICGDKITSVAVEVLISDKKLPENVAGQLKRATSLLQCGGEIPTETLNIIKDCGLSRDVTKISESGKENWNYPHHFKVSFFQYLSLMEIQDFQNKHIFKKLTVEELHVRAVYPLSNWARQIQQKALHGQNRSEQGPTLLSIIHRMKRLDTSLDSCFFLMSFLFSL